MGIVGYNAALVACAQVLKWRQGMWVLHDMLRWKVPPDALGIGSIAAACEQSHCSQASLATPLVLKAMSGVVASTPLSFRRAAEDVVWRSEEELDSSRRSSAVEAD